MRLVDAIERLQQAQQELGDDAAVSVMRLIEIVFSPEVVEEHKARERMVRDVVKAKRDAGFPLDSVFFRDVWPPALAALKALRSTRIDLGWLPEELLRDPVPGDDIVDLARPRERRQINEQGAAAEMSVDIVRRLQERIADNYGGNSLESFAEPIATLLEAIDEIVRLRRLLVAATIAKGGEIEIPARVMQSINPERAAVTISRTPEDDGGKIIRANAG